VDDQIHPGELRKATERRKVESACPEGINDREAQGVFRDVAGDCIDRLVAVTGTNSAPPTPAMRTRSASIFSSARSQRTSFVYGWRGAAAAISGLPSINALVLGM
jgi:hypothetical protein